MWQAEGRMERAGELAAWHVAMIVARLPLTAESLVPAKINPYRVERPASAAMSEVLAWQAARRWRLQCGGK